MSEHKKASISKTNAPYMPNVSSYRQYLDQFSVQLPDRTWPNKKIAQAPIWCSVDLRDGNQALVRPMDLSKKIKMFNLLVELGFKEIEIGFPSASDVEFRFNRELLEQGLIPADVFPQVLTQARNHLIDKTFESLQGYKQAIVHLYNSTSELQRRVVFGMSKSEILDIALKGTQRVKEHAAKAAKSGTNIVFQYSPESFTGTELDFALEVCSAVIKEWAPQPDRKMIINLPETVQLATPNVYADQIEWFSRHLPLRDSVLLSLHTHNDRGTGVASTELGMMAGADRVEGTLFGNGERTGNVDLTTIALNLYTQGVDPKLDLRRIPQIAQVFESCTEMPIHPRHPYVGELVFTAFSGSHQDAIRKGMKAQAKDPSGLWAVPYVPINPLDIGREFEGIIRINSQSGKGGVAYVMEHEFGCHLPKEMHPEFSAIVQRISDVSGDEVTPAEIWAAFSKTYLEGKTPYKFIHFKRVLQAEDSPVLEGKLIAEINGKKQELSGTGNGPIDACRNALLSSGCFEFRIANYFEHARASGSDAEAVCFIQIETSDSKLYWGVGIDSNIETSSLLAIFSALNRVNAQSKIKIAA